MRYFYRILNHLRKNLPLKSKITVRRTKLPKAKDGDCSYRNDIFCIRIDKTLPEHSAIDVLLHEIAHVLSWEESGDEHSSNWGKSYSLVYRKFLEYHNNGHKISS